MHPTHYDIIVVGAGVAGSALAHALSTITSKIRGSAIRVALLERSLSEPDRMVGEILQAGGIAALEKLGMVDAVEGIDAIAERGICFVQPGRLVHLPYPDGQQALAFHHGRFVMRLRDYAKRAAGVDVIEATVNELIECESTKRVLGVRATRSSPGSAKVSFFADLVIMADGGSSNFRNAILGKSGRPTSTPNYAIGTILKNVQLPMPQHGHAIAVDGHSAVVVMFQKSEHDTRFALNIKHPLPSDMKEYILANVIPCMPKSLHRPIREALDRDRLRRMPNSCMPSVLQGGKNTKEGTFLLGDSLQMRHSAAGGGMTIALKDVVLLAGMLGSVENFGHWDQISDVLTRWYWVRKPTATAMSLVSLVFDAISCTDDEYMLMFRNIALGYMECNSECFMSIVSGTRSSPTLLFYELYKVAIYACWAMFTYSRPVSSMKGEAKVTFSTPSVWQYPSLFITCVKMFWTVGTISVPAVLSEMRWW